MQIRDREAGTRLTERNKELIPETRWGIWKRMISNEDDVGIAERGWREMKSECCEKVEQRWGYADTDTNAPSSECPPNTCHVMSYDMLCHVTCHVVWYVMSYHVMSCQRRRAVPLRLIWTIMVAAKLDHSRVLVTMFHQNRLTLKGRSAGRNAGQRHRQTGANFKIYLLRQFCSNRVLIFYNTQETQSQKWWTRILKFGFCNFWEFFEIFKKASCGPSATDLDHYGRGQTRSD